MLVPRVPNLLTVDLYVRATLRLRNALSTMYYDARVLSLGSWGERGGTKVRPLTPRKRSFPTQVGTTQVDARPSPSQLPPLKLPEVRRAKQISAKFDQSRKTGQYD